MRYVSGQMYDGDGFREGYVGIDNDRVIETGYGKPPEKAFMTGIIVPGLADCHTHVGDAGLKVPEGIGLAELVAPPDGLKHRYLRETSDDVIVSSIRSFTDRMYNNGITQFIDFREGGVKGCRLLLKAKTKPSAVILGRPISPEYDPEEIDSILDIADGIGLPSISDMDLKYIESVASHVRERGKILSLHVSERVREDIDTVLSLDPSFIIHMTKAYDSDIKKCADAGLPVVLCPRSNIFFGNVPPAKKMIDSGVKISLGTDNAMLCSPDIREEMKILTELIGGRENNEVELFRILLNNGRELLYRRKRMGLAGADPGITVFPSGDTDVLSGILGNIGNLLTLRK